MNDALLGIALGFIIAGALVGLAIQPLRAKIAYQNHLLTLLVRQREAALQGATREDMQPIFESWQRQFKIPSRSAAGLDILSGKSPASLLETDHAAAD